MFRSAPLSSSSGQETPSLPDSAVDHELVLFLCPVPSTGRETGRFTRAGVYFK